MRRFSAVLLGLAMAGCASTAMTARWPAPTLDGARPLLIAHRGASGERPEHTLEGYRLAIAEGADCIEPDLVITKDGVLVSRHDTYLSTTTDVAAHPEFASRKRVSPDPEFPTREDWWVADFTLAELKTLRAVQSFRGRSKAYDGQFSIPTFAEVLALAKSSRTRAGEPVCVYPEAKAPAYHARLGHEMLAPILAALREAGLDQPGAPVFLQSFEPAFVKRAFDLSYGPTIVLLAGSRADYDKALATYEGVPQWNAVGITHPMVIDRDGKSTGLVEAAHAQGLAVHIWTYRDDAPPYSPQPMPEAMAAALRLGVDGVFTDFPATGSSVLEAFH